MQLQTILFGEFKRPAGKMTTRRHLILQHGRKAALPYAPPKQRPPKTSPVSAKMLAILKTKSGMTTTECADAMRTNKKAVMTLLARLRNQGLVMKQPGLPRPGGGRLDSRWFLKEYN